MTNALPYLYATTEKNCYLVSGAVDFGQPGTSAHALSLQVRLQSFPAWNGFQMHVSKLNLNLFVQTLR